MAKKKINAASGRGGAKVTKGGFGNRFPVPKTTKGASTVRNPMGKR